VTSEVSTALALGAASGLAVAGLFPYLLTIAPKLRLRPRPLWVLIVSQSVRAVVVLSALAWCGLRLGTQLGLDAPLIRSWISGRQRAIPFESLAIALACGAAAAVLILILDRRFFFRTLPPAVLDALPRASRWKGLLASFYGAIVEEILSRLFLMTVLVWILLRVPGSNASIAMALSCLLSALAFAVGHLPAAAQTGPLSRPVVTRILVLNTLAGIVFGALFAKYGLEHAMAAHFAADLVLHVVVN
jgi:hypothetical protein